jgi:zinc transporter ZupT
MLTLIFGIIAGSATLLGMWLIVAHEAWARRNTVYLIAFSVGVLITAALTDIIPEAIELNANTFNIVLGTFFVFYVLEHSVIAHHHHLHQPESTGADHPIEKLAYIGLLFHSLIDGFAIGAGFAVSTELGALATLAVVLHEIPEGVTAISLLIHSGYPRKLAIRWTSLVALATPAGAITVSLAPALLSSEMLGALLAVAGGSFLYVATAHLISETRGAKHIPAILLVAFGIAVSLLAGMVIHG